MNKEELRKKGIVHFLLSLPFLFCHHIHLKWLPKWASNRSKKGCERFPWFFMFHGIPLLSVLQAGYTFLQLQAPSSPDGN